MIEGVKQIHTLQVGDKLRIFRGRMPVDVEVLAVRGATVYVAVPHVSSGRPTAALAQFNRGLQIQELSRGPIAGVHF